jgi:hypothetical protein
VPLERSRRRPSVHDRGARRAPANGAPAAYIVDGVVAAIKHEADGDLHVILRDGTHQMIVELPDPRCSQGSLAIAAIRRARVKGTRLRVGQRVRVVGVLLIDHLHGQGGAAPNGAELHPVLKVEVLH